MSSSSSDIAIDTIGRSRRAVDREVVRPRRRSWFYRFFVAPFTDMDERAIYSMDERAIYRRMQTQKPR